MTHDDWTAAAMSDGSLVADLLVHLRRATPPATPPLTWQVRQRRSRPVLQKPTDTASPTTPLSWSGGATSASAAAAATDQVVDANENTASKRSRKKKTLAELKEDEALILKERNNLKKKLDSLRATVEIERAANDRLKRLKLDYVSWSAKAESLHVPGKENFEMISSYSHLSADSKTNNKYEEQTSLSICPKPLEEVMNQENKFMLPDLNLPIEDHTT